MVDKWDFCCGNDAFALELRELARKASAELILCTDEVLVDADGSYLTNEPQVPSRWAPELLEIARRRTLIYERKNKAFYGCGCLITLFFFLWALFLAYHRGGIAPRQVQVRAPVAAEAGAQVEGRAGGLSGAQAVGRS